MPEHPKKPAPDAEPGSPEIAAWMATLDHSGCLQDSQGACHDIHCATFGKALGAEGFFAEVIIAPQFDPEAIDIIRKLKAWGSRVRLIERCSAS